MKVIGIHTTNGVTVIRVRRWWFWFDEWAKDGASWRRLSDGQASTPWDEHWTELNNALAAEQLREKVYGAT